MTDHVTSRLAVAIPARTSIGATRGSRRRAATRARGNGSPRCSFVRAGLRLRALCRPVSGLAGLDRPAFPSASCGQWRVLDDPHRLTVAGAAAALAQNSWRRTAFPFHPPGELARRTPAVSSVTDRAESPIARDDGGSPLL
jgi:hypothetical protein